jgi:hypothetical protein
MSKATISKIVIEWSEASQMLDNKEYKNFDEVTQAIKSQYKNPAMLTNDLIDKHKLNIHFKSGMIIDVRVDVSKTENFNPFTDNLNTYLDYLRLDGQGVER